MQNLDDIAPYETRQKSGSNIARTQLRKLKCGPETKHLAELVIRRIWYMDVTRCVSFAPSLVGLLHRLAPGELHVFDDGHR